MSFKYINNVDDVYQKLSFKTVRVVYANIQGYKLMGLHDDETDTTYVVKEEIRVDDTTNK